MWRSFAGFVLVLLLSVAVRYYIDQHRFTMDRPTFIISFLLQNLILPEQYPKDVDDAKKWRSILGMLSKKSMLFQYEGSKQDVELYAEDGTVLPARIYTPHNLDHVALSPTLVWIHGGGCVMGSIDWDDKLAAQLATEARMVTLSISYRLAPEHPYPAAVHDVYAALKWWRLNASKYGADPNRVYLAGESAGGNLAAAVASYNLDESKVPKDEREVISGLALIYPGLAADGKLPSYHRHGQLGVLTSKQTEQFRQVYANYNESVRREYTFAPLLTPDHIIAQYPPTLLVSAGYDPILDDSILFAARLRQAKANVRTRLFDTSSHFFFGMDWVPHGRESVAFVGEVLRDMELK